MPITLVGGQEYQLDVPLTPVEPPPEKARLYGFITDANTGAAIPGAILTLTRNGVTWYSTQSVGNGYYDIPDIEPGTYSGLVTAEGYIDYPF